MFNVKVSGFNDIINEAKQFNKKLNSSGNKVLLDVSEDFKKSLTAEMNAEKTGYVKTHRRPGTPSRRSSPKIEGLANDSGHSLSLFFVKKEQDKVTFGIGDNSNDERGNYFEYWQDKTRGSQHRPTFERALSVTEKNINNIITKHIIK